MSGVVLRCPNCGTTRGTPGECAACHEAEVRYYCTNHTPGRWLDAAGCNQCGAKFGQAPRPRPPAPAPTARAPSPAYGRPRGIPRPAPAPPVARPPTYRPPPDTVEEVEEVHGRRPRNLHELLLEAARQRERERARARARYEPPPEEEVVRPVARGLGGCLLRLVLLFFFVMLALTSGFFGFFRVF